MWNCQQWRLLLLSFEVALMCLACLGITEERGNPSGKTVFLLRGLMWLRCKASIYLQTPVKHTLLVRLRGLSPPPLLSGEAGGTCKPTQPGAVSNNTLGRKSGQASWLRGEFRSKDLTQIKSQKWGCSSELCETLKPEEQVSELRMPCQRPSSWLI